MPYLKRKSLAYAYKLFTFSN